MFPLVIARTDDYTDDNINRQLDKTIIMTIQLFSKVLKTTVNNLQFLDITFVLQGVVYILLPIKYTKIKNKCTVEF